MWRIYRYTYRRREPKKKGALIGFRAILPKYRDRRSSMKVIMSGFGPIEKFIKRKKHWGNHRIEQIEKKRKTSVYERGRSEASSVKPSLSDSEDSVLTTEKCGLPGRILKLILEPKLGFEPSSYTRRAASYSIFSCSACARNG